MAVPPAASTLQQHDHFRSRFVPDEHDLTVYLPPGYAGTPGQRYPVLYLQDGQNLFDPDKAFIKGQHWRVGEAATGLIEAGLLRPLIIVGVSNAGAHRIDEYTPTNDKRQGGGAADAYGRLLVEEIKPFVDATYRTLTDGFNTGLGGSSLGGLVTLYLGLKYPQVFTRLAVMSPSVWWDKRAILKNVRHARPKPPLRIWVDIGLREGRPHVENTRLLRAGLVKNGWVDGEDLHYLEVPDGTHSEGSWASRLDRVLRFLYP